MKKNAILKIVALFVFGLFVSSCSDDDSTPQTITGLTIEKPSDEYSNLTEVKLIAENVNTGEKKDLTVSVDFNEKTELILNQGVYNFTLTAKAEILYKGSGNPSVVDIKGSSDKITLNQDNQSVVIKTIDGTGSQEGGFVISEVYFAGCNTAGGNFYHDDSYFEIYNNSNKTLYADNLSIGITSFNTDNGKGNRWIAEDDFVDEAVSIKSIFTIPGDGTKYPVKPGEVLLISDRAINHKTFSPNSVDLSKSNFEWYEPTASNTDVDVPEVENLVVTFSTSKSLTPLHTRGCEGYYLFRMDKEGEAFLKENTRLLKEDFVMNDKVFTNREEKHPFVPNSLIIDAVQCAEQDEHSFNVFAKSLDFSYVSTGDSFAARAGKVIRRKFEKMDGTRVVLQDSNDSSKDFHSIVVPSPGTVETE
ncbi:MAG: DUF4876 domain-containing protein [Marinifilaceae bacterium]|jgi:hypothetical protein|nr:DUF4876 domain-containing protein [Marinifilaceae bacterium]